MHFNGTCVTYKFFSDKCIVLHLKHILLPKFFVQRHTISITVLLMYVPTTSTDQCKLSWNTYIAYQI